MSDQRQNNLIITETNVIASRRSFLTRIAYGSLLALGGSEIAEAAVKHVTHSAVHKKTEPKHASKSGKSSLHDRMALKSHSNSKTVHNSHREHKTLASNSHDHRVHSSLHKDHNGGHRYHEDAHQRLLASHDSRHSLRRERDMPEFAFHEEGEFTAPRIHSNVAQNRFVSPGLRGRNVAHKTLSLENTTTGDNLRVTYFEKGRYLPDALHEINFLYRDHLTDEIHPVDVALLDQLHDLQTTLGVDKRPIHVICGYRSPFTNAHLRRNSHGVARHSLHMEGRAIDIRMTGVDSRTVRDAALSLAKGGVGYYPGSDFVHLDTGDFRTW
jgi:uncharacterized protein YcbK (DUF882 family)